MKYAAGLLILTIILMASGCEVNPDNQDIESPIPVEVLRVVEETRPRKSSFIGTAQPGMTVQLSFKTGGRINEIRVEKGDRVKKGDILASLEKTDLAYAESLAKAQLEMVKAQYEKALNGATSEDIEQARLNVSKAEDTYRYAEEQFEEVERLYLQGTASKQVYDQAKLERDIRKSDLKLAKEMEAQVLKGARHEEIKALEAQLESAQTEYDYRRSMLDNAVLISGIDGVVMEVLSEKGEITGAGYPVVVLRSDEKIVYVGVPDKELKKITPETKVFIEYEEMQVESGVIRISEIPDTLTGLYNIEVKADEIDIPFGASVTVSFLYGEDKGIFVPITAINSGIEDYVYIVSDGRAVRRPVKIEGIDNFDARVTGIFEDEYIITSGVGRISAGSAVSVKE
ncbi:MAG: biotin/lipoyl-binding protein [Bacillota bacterium]|jgi:HlyD family secretion protein|nr:biotin/lipoyl-binding protein [Bacillota bacterium]NLV62804.1 biotin/lipoyl-binding protein [Clostridiaceae bacterium]